LKATWSKGKSIKINCTLPVSTYSFLIFGTTLMWKFAQCGQVREEKILILTGALSGPRIAKLLFVAILSE
jgi:hypothetical protein